LLLVKYFNRLRRRERRSSHARPLGGMTRWRRTPRPLAFALELARDEWAPQTVLGEVQRVWLAAVGPAIAAEARPTAERSGVVTVSCSAAVWAQELDLMGATIVPRVNDLLPNGRVERLRCIAMPSPSDLDEGVP
jgi:predicted nucleic acid-binding Zn ribbon protein